MNVLLSIKPRFAEAIFSGEKRFEFRKTVFKNENVDKVYLYVARPIKKVKGYFKIANVIHNDIDLLWKICEENSGITYEEFKKYFNGRSKGYAIEIGDLVKFDNPIDPKELIENFSAPQSFRYVDFDLNKNEYQVINELTSKEISSSVERITCNSRILSNKFLDIGHDKICDCPSNHINCLTPKEWIQCQVGIWEFSYEKRDIRDKSIHPAVFPIGLPARCIKLFTHEGELVLDPFSGIGTTLLAAKDLNRNAVGFDLKQEYIDVTNKRLSQSSFLNTTKQIAVRDDARNIKEYLKKETIALVVTSPPYSKFLNKPRKNKSMRGDLRNNKHYDTVQQYSQDPNDIGTLEPIAFSKEIAKIYKNILPLLKPKAHCVININDLWWENKRSPTHAYIIDEMLKVGYDLRNVLIWDRRNLVNRVGIFGWPNNYIKLGTTFEYILDFWKPPA